MQIDDIKSALENFDKVKIGVIGDFALDIYYNLIQNTGENSIETGRPVVYGSSIKSQLGAAGNIANNLVTLGVKDIYAFGLVGDDILGRELKYQLNNKKINVASLISLDCSWETYTYVKPLENKDEISRLDFGSQNISNDESINTLLENLKKILNS